MNIVTKFGIGAGLMTSSLCFGTQDKTKTMDPVAPAKAVVTDKDKCPPIRMGVVDPAKVYDSYRKAKAAQEKFELLVKQIQSEIDKRMEEGKTLFNQREELVAKYQNPTTPEEVKTKLVDQLKSLEEDIQKKGEEITLFRQQSDRNLEEQRRKILEEHYKEIEYVVQKISREKNMHITFNAQSVFYFNPCILDLTEEVIAELNKTTVADTSDGAKSTMTKAGTKRTK